MLACTNAQAMQELAVSGNTTARTHHRFNHIAANFDPSRSNNRSTASVSLYSIKTRS